MNQPSSYTAFLDSTALFSVFISNLLLFLSETDLFRVRWSEHVHAEWIDARMRRYPDTNRTALENKRRQMNTAFPEALVVGYESLIDQFYLPDINDRHVVAAADKAKADVIITNNIDDFPEEGLPSGLFAQTEDDFIVNQFNLTSKSARLVAIAFVRHKKNLTKSRPTWKQYFAKLHSILPKTFLSANTADFRKMIGEILKADDWSF